MILIGSPGLLDKRSMYYGLQQPDFNAHGPRPYQVIRVGTVFAISRFIILEKQTSLLIVDNKSSYVFTKVIYVVSSEIIIVTKKLLILLSVEVNQFSISCFKFYIPSNIGTY